MSRSSVLIENPSVKTFKWKNEKFNKKTKKVERETGWYYWDKTQNDGEGAEVLVEMPLTFMWLESAQSFTGFHKTLEKGIYSNEIIVTKDAVAKYGLQELTVKCGNEDLAQGFYKDIKEDVTSVGGKFCIPVYALMQDKESEQFEVVRFLMSGSSGSAWMNFNNRTNNMSKAVVCFDKKEVEMKTGDTYDEPVFKYVAATPEMVAQADEAAQQVDAYFDYLYSANKTPVTADY